MNRAVDDGRIAPTERWFRHRALGALGLAAALIAPAAARPAIPRSPTALAVDAAQPATPALWEVRDGDTTIYLFGTFHTLDARTAWFDRSVRAAFDRSGELVLETIAPTDPAEVRAIGRSVAGPRPAPNGFLSATRSAVERGRADGLSVEHGADSVLRRAASDQGMSLSGIEHFADQLRTFARISAAPPAPLAAAPRRGGRAGHARRPCSAAWKAGDTRAFAPCSPGSRPSRRSPIACSSPTATRSTANGSRIASTSRARCSSRSGRAISRARTASRTGSRHRPSRASPSRAASGLSAGSRSLLPYGPAPL